jgi:hypothetical protein
MFLCFRSGSDEMVESQLKTPTQTRHSDLSRSFIGNLELKVMIFHYLEEYAT